MTTGEAEGTEEPCGRRSKQEAGSRAAQLKPGGSCTALSTVAIQAGRSQIVASVLRSGSLVHLQLVQFQPGLCEIGSNQEENHVLIQEHQQLLEKLQKHEPEVLAVVEKNQPERPAKRRDGGRKEELKEAMKASLKEGWSLLLQLLQRRLEVLKLASEFFHRVTEFSVSIETLEDLQTEAEEDKLSEVQASYHFMRKDLLGKSLQVLTSSSILLHRLRQLQRTEALQRRGGVLQGEEEEAEEIPSRGPVLRLEELVEALQDRRRRADQAFRLQLQKAEQVLEVKEESNRAGAENQSLLDPNLASGSRLDRTLGPGSEGASEFKRLKSGCSADLESESWSEPRPKHEPEDLEDVNLEAGSRLQESGPEPDVKPDSWLDPKSHSRLNHLKSGSISDLLPESRSAEARNQSLGPRSGLKLISASQKTKNLKPSFLLEEITEAQPGPDKTRTFQSESSSAGNKNLETESRSDMKTEPGSQNATDLQSDPRTRSELPTSGLQQGDYLMRKSGSEQAEKQRLESRTMETRDLQFSFRTVHKTRLDESGVKPGSGPGETGSEVDEQPQNSASLQQARTGSEKTRILRSAESTELQTGSWLDLKTEPESHGTKGAQTDFKSEPKNRSKSAVLGSGSKEGKDLRPASRSDETSKPRLDSRTSLPGSGPILRTRTHGAQTSVCDVKPGSTPDDTSTQLSGSRSEETGTRHAGSRPDGIRTPELICSSENISESASLRSASTEEPRSRSETTRTLPSESGSVGITDLLPRSRWKNQSGSGAPGSGSQDLKPLSGSERTRKEESKNSGFPSDLRTRLRSDERHKRDSDARPGSESAGTRTQQTGSRSEVSGSGSDLPSAKRQLHETKLGLNEQQADHQMEVQQQQEDQTSRSGHQERLVKTLQDLNCVSELLDSCSQMDLGSELQTSRLLEHFRQAEPHFRQLDAEVEHTVGGWESLQEELSELLKIQQTVKDKKQQSESILKLSSSFHDTARQMELLLQSEPVGLLTGSTGSTGSREAELSRLQEAKQQIQNLLHTTATLRTDICAAVSQSNWAGFQTEQLEGRLGSLDSVCESWLNEAGQCEAELRREHLTHLLLGDVTQLRESFKELKKRFSNTKFNYLKRNDRTRNLKAVRNQLQQMEAYQEKLQGLRKRVHGVAARLGPEVKNTCVARQVEDAVNELQRQTGQLERNISEHQKTLDMTCRLQQAMEEYQFWCEDASATIARVGRFSLECRSTEAVSVLYRQFEKFVWPTVPQQEERIGQITELAVRLHGVEEGQRYIEKTVSKHSEMVESIKELSDGLMELEAKLKLESLKQQQNDEEEEGEEEGEREHRRQTEEQEKKKETRRMQQRDNRSTQEAADMCELKETGHTPELIAKIDRNEAPEATRKPPLEKSPSQEVYGPTASRELPGGKLTSSTHILTACSPEDARQQVQATHNQSQAVTTEYKATPFQSGPLFPDNQEDFQREIEGTEQQMASSSCGSNTDSLQETQPEAMTEDFFFNDESDCASPDDISLPPLAETPESNMFQSDVEEGFCFSSLSVHVSHKCHAQSEPTGTASVQQKESGQTESCPAPSVSLQTSTRFRSESRSFTPSPSTVPLTSLFTSTLCTILKSKEPSTVFSLDNPVNVYDTIDCSKDKKALKKRSLSGTLKQDLSQSLHPQSFNGADTGLHNHSIPKGDTGVHEFSPSYTGKDCILPEKRDLPESHHGTTSQSHQGMHSVKYSGETTPRRDSRIKTSVSLVSQQNIYIRSSFSGNHCSNSHSDPVPKSERFSQTSRVTDPVLHKDVTQAQDEDFIEPSTTIPQRSTTPQDPNHSQNSTSSRGEPDQDAPSTLRNRSLRTTATDTQQRVFNQPFPSGQSQTDTISNQDPRDPPEGLVHSPTQPRSVSNAGICSSKQRLQASLTSSGTQQCVHDPSMSPSSAQPAPPHPEPQTHASPHPPNLHATSPCSPPRLLTPSQDPDICLPVAIREEIRLTPQIQGPALPPARLPQPSSESPPPRKPSEPGLPCFPRPWPHAMVMEGSPVTLEVEVKGNPEPRLTRFTHEGAPPRHTDRDQNRDREQSQQLAGSSSGVGDKWLVLEALDVIMEDWNTWFGTLCVLLWLLYLILL